MTEGYSVCHLPTAWHKESSVFITQQTGVVSCREGLAENKGVHRRIHLSGLKNATVLVYAEME